MRVILAFAAVYLIWGSTYLAIRFAIETLPPFLMAGARFLVSGTILYLWARRRHPVPSRTNWRAAALIGALLLLIGNGGVVWAEQRIPSGLAALLVAVEPLWVVLLVWARGTPPGGRVLAGLAVGFTGLFLLISPGEVLGGGAVDMLGAAVVVFAALSWAAGSVYAQRAPLPESPLLSTGMQMLAGGSLLLLAGTATGEWNRLDLAGATLRSWLALGYLIVFGALVAFSAYSWLVRNVEPSKVATYAYVNPVVAVLLGWLLASEPLSVRTGVAAAVIVGAVAFITTAPRSDSGPQPQPPAQPASASWRGRKVASAWRSR
jgi:drug/metabolite transporter (DMT)-like permease